MSGGASGVYGYDMIELIQQIVQGSMSQETAMGTVSSITNGQAFVVFDGSSVAQPVQCGQTVVPFTGDRVVLLHVGSEWVIIQRTVSVVTPGNETLLSEQILVANAATVTITNIPQTFRDLRITTSLRDAAVGSYFNWALRFNNDSSAVYAEMGTFISNFSGAAGYISNTGITSTGHGMVAGSNSAGANVWGNSVVELPDYARSGTEKNGFYQSGIWNGSTTGLWATGYFSYANTAPITTLQLFPSGGTSLVTGSIIRLYGIGGVTGQ